MYRAIFFDALHNFLSAFYCTMGGGGGGGAAGGGGGGGGKEVGW